MSIHQNPEIFINIQFTMILNNKSLFLHFTRIIFRVEREF